MTFEQKSVDDLSQNTKRRCPCERVAHQRSTVPFGEFVKVRERLEIALDHLVNKQVRPVKHDNFDGQSLADSEMLTLKSHGLPQSDLAVGHTGDGLFICFRNGLSMYADITHQVETDLTGSVDLDFKHYSDHLYY